MVMRILQHAERMTAKEGKKFLAGKENSVILFAMLKTCAHLTVGWQVQKRCNAWAERSNITWGRSSRSPRCALRRRRQHYVFSRSVNAARKPLPGMGRPTMKLDLEATISRPHVFWKKMEHWQICPGSYSISKNSYDLCMGGIQGNTSGLAMRKVAIKSCRCVVHTQSGIIVKFKIAGDMNFDGPQFGALTIYRT